MGRARGHGSRTYIVYSDILAPLDSSGWPLDTAFSAMLEKCGYAAAWGTETTATLHFRQLDGAEKGHVAGVRAPIDHPAMFTAEVTTGNAGIQFAQENIMKQVLASGLKGWFGLTQERFSIQRLLAEQGMRDRTGEDR